MLILTVKRALSRLQAQISKLCELCESVIISKRLIIKKLSGSEKVRNWPLACLVK